MSIRIACQGCNATYVVDDELRGKQIRCRKCEQPVAVPASHKKADAGVIDKKSNAGAVAAAARPRQQDNDDGDDRKAPRRDRDAVRSTKKKGSSGALLW